MIPYIVTWSFILYTVLLNCEPKQYIKEYSYHFLSWSLVTDQISDNEQK